MITPTVRFYLPDVLEYGDVNNISEILNHTHSHRVFFWYDKDELKQKEKLKIKDYGDKVTFHDPCYLGRIGGETEAPREAIGGDLIEMERSREKSFCCGGGGARIWMEEDADKRVNEIRAKEAVNTGADCVAVGCPFCMTMMSDGLKTLGEEQRTVKDISEIMLENLEE